MAFRGTDVLSKLQGRLIEPRDGGASWPSELWTPQEVHRYLHEQQVRVLRETGCLISIAWLGLTVPGTTVVDLPEDCLQVVRIGWQRTTDLKHFEIPPADLFEADMARSGWITESQSFPIAYSIGEADDVPNQRGDLNRLRLIGSCTDPGIIEVWYVALPAPLADQGNPVLDAIAAADILTVPDVAMPAVLWGTLEQQTAKVARGADQPRASYAREMRTIAIESIQIILRGWEA